MRKFILLAAGLMAAAAILLSTGAAAESKSELLENMPGVFSFLRIDKFSGRRYNVVRRR